jgi:hypothetical protein
MIDAKAKKLELYTVLPFVFAPSVPVRCVQCIVRPCPKPMTSDASRQSSEVAMKKK